MGGISVLSASPDLNRVIQDLSLPLPESGFLHTFYRVLIGSQMFYTANYGRVKKRNSFTVAFHKDHVTRQKFFGKIQLFIIINNHAYVFISCLVPDSTSSFHAFNVEYLKCKCFPVSDGPLELVPVKCIIEKCIYIEVEGRKYISRFPTMLSLV